jgi:hypothetical protein
MTADLTNRVLLIGLPATGKTSFLAALWYLVQHRQILTRLRLKEFDGDNGYLNQIANAWAEYKLVPRTLTDSEKVVSMILKHVQTEKSVTVIFPDLSGESFSLQWTTRQCTQSYNEFLKVANGAILFLSPLNYRKPIRIDMANPLVEIIVRGKEMQEPVQDTSLPPMPWSPERVPTQVEVVELLQFISSSDDFNPPFRLAVVISAWDQLVNLKRSPSDWLSIEFPLVDQFLASNKDKFEIAVFGVSAQGADYSQIVQLVEMKPSDRIQVTGRNVENPHDLTEPLLWLTT